eukprot:TRINITY_DN17255_c0_g1_i1.p1 TRINITY_DN17255_c0_g1~~TRINITY_DN17255_c0_g1_i1.p1  ORF type:complete len:173 (-),score=60.91 TRINITY_DN17255_c0_g1_i1:439-933(-)
MSSQNNQQPNQQSNNNNNQGNVNSPSSVSKKPQLKKPVFIHVSDLEPGSHGHNLILKVVKTNMVVEKTRTDGQKVRIAEAVVGDNTGCITLTARNAQVDVVQPGETIIARNAKIDMFRGYMRLAVDKWGKLEKAPEPAKFEVDTTNDLCAVEYELVEVADEERM